MQKTKSRRAYSTVIASPHRASNNDLDYLALLVTSIRPSWDHNLVRVVLYSHADQVDCSDLAIAAIRAAQDPHNETPKSIGWRGPHWDATVTKPRWMADRRRCLVCGKNEARCYGERPGLDDDHQFEAASP